MVFYPVVDKPIMADKALRNLRAIDTGIKRKPKKGDWFLSRGIVRARKAPIDLDAEYRIAELVLIEITPEAITIKEHINI